MVIPPREWTTLIDLNPGSMLTADASSQAQKWAACLTQHLNNNNNSESDQYLLLRTESMTSMALFLYIKKSHINSISQITGSSKKTGMGGMTANKGACAVRFNYGNSSFVLITSHLAAGVSATLERYNDYMSVVSGLKFLRNMQIFDHDYVVWFGDLNYRIEIENGVCRSMIEQQGREGLRELYENLDQLVREMRKNDGVGAFGVFKEGEVGFLPTYKFDTGTNEYDSSEKQRVPSWTDRILYVEPFKKRNKNGIKQLNYNSVMDVMVSDHKPVYSTFECLVKFIDRTKKSTIRKSLYDNYKQQHGSTYDLLSLNDDVSSITSAASSRASSFPPVPEENFAIDTMSDLNLLDDYDPTNPPPKLPSRPTVGSAPKRVPPPPLSRKVLVPSNKQQQPSSPARKLPPPPSSYSQLQVPERPLPPASRKVSSPSPAPVTAPSSAQPLHSPPIGFSSAPLVPMKSNSSGPSANGLLPKISPVLPVSAGSIQRRESASSLSALLSPKVFKPLVPTKPKSLTSIKLKESKSEEDDDKEDMKSVSSEPARSVAAPVPPPPRTSTMKSMSDWKPLVPK